MYTYIYIYIYICTLLRGGGGRGGEAWAGQRARVLWFIEHALRAAEHAFIHHKRNDQGAGPLVSLKARAPSRIKIIFS